MKAIRIHQHGGPEVLQIDDVNRPKPLEHEALIKVHAASLNHLDLWARRGLPGINLPLIPGSDAAGTIVDLGSSAKKQNRFKAGDEVIMVPFRSCAKCAHCLSGEEQLCPDYHIAGENMHGTMSEFITVPLFFLIRKPANLDWSQSAAFPLAFLTAWHMLTSKVRIKSGDVVFIWGASSGVGHAAIQIARHFNATVITTAGDDRKAEFARQCGAHHVLNYHKDDVAGQVRGITSGHGADIIFEHVGQQSWNHSLKILARGGRIVTCGATTGAVVRIDLRHLFIKHQQIIGSTMGNHRDMRELTEMIAQGLLLPHVDHTFHYTEIIEAHRYMEAGKHLGKVVVRFGD